MMEPEVTKEPLTDDAHPWPQPPYQHYPEPTVQAESYGGIQPSYSQQPPQGSTPPPYYPQQPGVQQTWPQTNVVVVQPQVVTQTVQKPFMSQYGIGALIFAITVTFIMFFCGWWVGLLCSGAAIAFAAYANSQAQSGKMQSAKVMQGWSICCSFCSLLSIFIVILLLVIYIVILVAVLYP